MNKTEFINALAEKTNLSKTDAANVVNAIFDQESGILVTALTGGGKVAVGNFGSFTLKTRAARQGVNPATREKIQIPESKVVKFSASTGLKSQVGG